MRVTASKKFIKSFKHIDPDDKSYVLSVPKSQCMALRPSLMAFVSETTRNTKGDVFVSGRVEDHLNPDFLLPRICRYTFYKSIPALLVNLGVLGTFTGLVLGIGGAGEGLTSVNHDDARHALSLLLGGAGIAFLTSLVGLGLSTLYSLYLSHSHSTLSHYLLKVADTIHAKHDVYSSHHALLGMQSLVLAQTEMLNQLLKDSDNPKRQSDTNSQQQENSNDFL